MKGELRVEKKDEETQEGLNGVEFTVYRYEYTGFTEYAELTTKTVDGRPVWLPWQTFPMASITWRRQVCLRDI